MNLKTNDPGLPRHWEFIAPRYCQKNFSQAELETIKTLEVLILSEDSSFSEAMGTILQDQGYQVYLAPDVRTALEELDNFNFDLLIVQLSRSDQPGLAAVHKARQAQSSPKVMVISGPQGKMLPVEAFEADVDDYLIFPFSTAEFSRRVAALLEPAAIARDQSPGGKINADTLGTLLLLMSEISNALLQATDSLQGLHRREFGRLSEGGAKVLDEVMTHISQAVGLAYHFHQKTSHISQMNGW
jgi:DNA-binding response OmpR family regulator